MALEKTRPHMRRTSLESEEERAWIGFYRRVGHDSTIATEVMTQLDSDSEMKRTHLALYLCCKESLQRHKAREARAKRIGQFTRWLCHGVFFRPWQSLLAGLHRGGDLAVECLPEAAEEPAVAQVRLLAREAEFATTRIAFKRRNTGPIAASGGTQVASSPRASHTG
jgi:hypothetical protein